MKKIIALALAFVLILSLCACSGSGDTSSSGDGNYVYNVTVDGKEYKVDLSALAATDKVKKDDVYKSYAEELGNFFKICNNGTTVYEDRACGFQLDAPENGEEIAVMHTSMGDISIRFFPEAAPKTVENFVTHAKNGYYDGLTFHRVINDFMIQGGDPMGTGAGGESIWGGSFEDEFDYKLYNLRGSISMANSGTNTNGSQFFINQKKDTTTKAELKAAGYMDYVGDSEEKMYQNYIDIFVAVKEQNSGDASFDIYSYFPSMIDFIKYITQRMPCMLYDIPDEADALYQKVGGNITLDGAFRAVGGHTVFGQVFKGMEIVDAIAAVETDDNDKPLTDVIINSIDIVTYNAQ